MSEAFKSDINRRLFGPGKSLYRGGKGKKKKSTTTINLIVMLFLVTNLILNVALYEALILNFNKIILYILRLFPFYQNSPGAYSVSIK